MKKLMLGDFAVARGAYEAGVRVATAYPGTPSTEITEEISKFKEVYAEWSPNEKVALEVGLGSSLAGARTLVSMKHVGLNVAADPLFTAAYTGVNGGLVIAVADDPGMHSSQNEQDTRLIARAAHVPVLEPSDSEEAKELTKLAFEISEQYDTPVILRLTTRVAHSQSIVELGKRKEIPLKEYKKDVAKNVMMPSSARKRHVFVEARMDRLRTDSESFDINRAEYNGLDLGVICAGGVYQYVKEALPNASVYKLGMVYPLPINSLKDFVSKVKRAVVIEELEPHIEDICKAAGLKVEGKNLFSVQGEIFASTIREKLFNEAPKIQAVNAVVRPPVLCAGCPHRGVFYIFNKMKLKVFGDIGCYTLGANKPLNGVDSVVCMGASIGMACGFQKADGEAYKSSVAVIGDSTFIHSGITGLIDAVYNKGKTTVVIVDNRTTGMTGHQNHPATGKTITEEDTYPLSLEDICRAAGVKSVHVADPDDLEGFEKLLKEELNKEEVSVVIARRPCALLEKKVYKGYRINDKCKKCRVCVRLGCPAINGSGENITIDVSLCQECGLCSKVCKFGAIDKAEVKA